jgi:uncharacterized protein
VSQVIRLSIHVKPGASRPRVKGEYGGALVVAVTERAVDGRATDAALASVARAFDVRRRQVRLVRGRTSRAKVVEIDGDPAELGARRDALLRPD